MRHVGLISAVVGLLLAVCAPARAESARHASDPDARSKTKVQAHKDCAAKAEAQHDYAAKDQAKASAAGKTGTASDTLVVPAAGPDKPGFTMVGENVTYDDPTFVPYKLREAARRARASVDVSTIP